MHILLTVIVIIYYSIIIIQLFNLKYKRQLCGSKIYYWDFREIGPKH